MAKESLSEQAYRLIRAMIVRLELTPGSVVREEDLQEQLEIGRTPIREALQRLADERQTNVSQLGRQVLTDFVRKQSPPVA